MIQMNLFRKERLTRKRTEFIVIRVEGWGKGEGQIRRSVFTRTHSYI